MSGSMETLRAGPAPGSDLAVEAILTTHRILGSFGRDPRSLEILHADIFDSRPQVALSSLQAVSEIADRRSLLYVARLFHHPDPQIVCAAARAAGAIASPEALPLLVSLSGSTRQESVQLEALRALARGFPQAPETRQLAAAVSRSVAVQPETAAAAREVLLQLESLRGAKSALELAGEQPDVLPVLLQMAGNDESLVSPLLEKLKGEHAGLSLELRSRLISLAAPLSSEAARSVFFDSLRDPSAAVRRECYRHIGNHPTQVPHFDDLCQLLLTGTEDQASMEEEALQALDAMQSSLSLATSQPELPSLAGLSAVIKSLFVQLLTAVEPDIDTSLEMGQQIAKAKEYLEFYFSNDARRIFLDSIKSGGTRSLRRRSARALKDSAVKLEMRHFEGYSIMYSLVADPSRPGVALFLRHLTSADIGKRGTLCRLKRALSLARLAPPADAAVLLYRILEWARAMKLFRLAELALLALHRVDLKSAIAVCLECMAAPVTTKVLTIASFDLLKDMDISAIEPTLIALLRENDRYIRLALLESLASLEAQPGVNLLGSLLQLFSSETDSEVSSKLVDLLGTKGDEGTASALIEVYDRLEEWKKVLSITLLARITRRVELHNRPALTEFLYRVLRADPPAVLARVPTALMALGDDFAANVLRDLLPRLGPVERTALVRDLRDDLRPAVIAVIWSLLRERDPGLQQALREILPLAMDPRAQQLLVSMVRTLRTKTSEAEPLDVEPLEADAVIEETVRLSSEKETYRFEREHVRTCAVLFSDIEGYSTKAQELSSIELSNMLREYEGILLPIVEAHAGALMKRMGDGHLFVFDERMDAVLAAIRVQKALRRYNRFHPEKQRVQVRIGIHWGEVVEREGDVLGNTVNIASRLQSVASGGSTCISREVYEAVAEWIHANDLGPMRIKGLRDPVQAWEPTEAALGMPSGLDPLKRRGRMETAPRKEATSETARLFDVERLVSGLAQVFQRLRDVSRNGARTGEEGAIEEEFVKGWVSLQTLIASLGKHPDESRPDESHSDEDEGRPVEKE
ncbi:MAG TPA: adenylate/guanylate cyclase domain-containing protein [Spirochaetia bacterium]|nr:adenylate/guanylate cyclase domain-containing protein [Spirochaetia bacterium]